MRPSADRAAELPPTLSFACEVDSPNLTLMFKTRWCWPTSKHSERASSRLPCPRDVHVRRNDRHGHGLALQPGVRVTQRSNS